MTERTSIQEAAAFLKEKDDFLILTHMHPDGDTLGAGFALRLGLCALGKRANVVCSDEIPERYRFLAEGYSPAEFEPQWIVAVDIADTQLLGGKLSVYADRINLCIDHHISNTLYAERTLLMPEASATCEMLYELLTEMTVPITEDIAMLLYTGIATDTGCFKYSNTTARTHAIASELLRFPIQASAINYAMFDVKSKSRLLAERVVTDSMEFHHGDCAALIVIPLSLLEQFDITEADLEGLASLPRQIEGVEVGVTLKERSPGVYKISMRSSERVNVSDLCGSLGGGGHARAAGCTLEGTLDEVKAVILDAVGKALGKLR